MEVNLGSRKIRYRGKKECTEKYLENGRNLKKIKCFPIKCEVKFNEVWKDSKHNIERTQHSRRRMAQDWTLSSSVPIELSPYNQHSQPYSAIIPDGGITRAGYVKKVWIEDYRESISIDNQSYEIITAYAHNTEQWIQGFKVGIDVFCHPVQK